MRIFVECGGVTSAAEACRTASQINALSRESLSRKLSGLAGMAGDDATSVEFATTYDAGATDALATLSDLTDAFSGLARLLTATGANHARAEAASAGMRSFAGDAGDDHEQVRAAVVVPPSSLGSNPPTLGRVEQLILDHVEGFVWPGADVDLLLDAADAWRTAGVTVTSLQDQCDIAAIRLEQQTSPEIPLALAAMAELRGLVGNTADALTALGVSCEDHAAAVRSAHQRTLDLLAEIGRMVVEGVVISAIVGGLTGGMGAGAAGTAALARIAAQAPRFHVLITGLRAATSAAAIRIRTTRVGLSAVRGRLGRFARVSARDERGSMRFPGGWSETRHPGWLRAHDVPPGHTLSRHVGKTVDELADRCVEQGISKASSFGSEEAAERLVGRTLREHEDRIAAWLHAGDRSKLTLDSGFSHPTGTTVDRFGNVTRPTGVRVILVPSDTTRHGWQILTAFPK